jgi:hypothetical protein
VANSSYYCYLVNGNAGIAPNTFTPNTVSFACSSSIGPTADGHPGANLVGSNFAATKNALFIGSFITDANAQIVRFYRDGQEVMLIAQPTAAVAVAVDQGVAAIPAYDPGVGGSSLSFTNNGNYPQEQSYTPTTFPLASASAQLLDIHVYNEDSASGHVVYVLDPSAAAVVAPFQEQVQASIQVNKASTAGAGANLVVASRAANARLRLNATNTGAVRFGMDTKPGKSVLVEVILRGYVEPIQQLFQ